MTEVYLEGGGRQGLKLVGSFLEAGEKSPEGKAGLDNGSGSLWSHKGSGARLHGSNPTYNLTFQYLHFLFCSMKIK